MNSQAVETDSMSYQKCVHFFNVNRNVELGFVQSGHHITESGYQ